MVDVIFYEKPGCINNARQKKLLQEAGHHLDERNLLAEPWTAAKLLAFFNNLPVNAWFNQSAPAVKSGEVDPDMLTAEQAIHCMLADPLLIRRPLMEVADRKIAGFEAEKLSELLKPGLAIDNTLESCPKRDSQSPCDTQ